MTPFPVFLLPVHSALFYVISSYAVLIKINFSVVFIRFFKYRAVYSQPYITKSRRSWSKRRRIRPTTNLLAQELNNTILLCSILYLNGNDLQSRTDRYSNNNLNFCNLNHKMQIFVSWLNTRLRYQ